MINYSCQHCGAALHIGDEWGGRQARCPTCHYVVWVGNTYQPEPAPKRTSKLKVLFRFLIIPVIVMASYCVFLPDWWEGFLYASIFLIIVVLLMWAFVNFYVYIGDPHSYRVWKAGGGDPFIDTLPSPINPDPDSVRYQELFQEKARQEDELVLDDLPPPPSAELPKNLKEFGDLLR